jgi:O-acetylhomoserine (thiol)-lyase
VLFDYADAQDLIDVFQGKKMGHVYSRSSSGSVNALQNMLNDMENGVGAVCFATGMAAISSTLLALLQKGDHLIVSRYLFGNTRSFFASLDRLGINVSYVDVTDVELVKQAVKTNTRGVFTETIANPVTQIADIQGLSALCSEHELLFMVDTTMTPSSLFNAKEQGVSLMFTSLTKYIGGHGNALGGAVIDCGNYNWQSYPHILPLYQGADSAQWGLTQIRKLGLRDFGATLSPHYAHMFSVGLETLTMRMQKNCQNALELAEFLSTHPAVNKVYYPGLAEHPQHERAGQLFSDYGAILSFDLKAEYSEIDVLNKMQLVICATHLGDNRTLALPVASTIFFENTEEERQEMGISPSMIRISVGIEDTSDIIADFTQSLDSVMG